MMQWLNCLVPPDVQTGPADAATFFVHIGGSWPGCCWPPLMC